MQLFSLSTDMDTVERILESRKWSNRCLRANIVKPEEVVMCKKTKIAFVESESPQPKRSKRDRALIEALKEIAPEWWGDDTRICINRNVKCERHKDGNKGHSYILWLGDFTGGALVFDDGVRIEEKYKWHKIDGQIYHWNEPHEGTKYSVIIYMGNGNTKKADLINRRFHQKPPASLPPETTDSDIDG